MRVALVSAALLIAVAVLAHGAPNVDFPLTPHDAKPGDLHAFAGQVVAVNRTARTITLGLPMRFTFKVPAATPVSVRRGDVVSFDAIRPGARVQIVALRGAKSWTAQKITLERRP